MSWGREERERTALVPAGAIHRNVGLRVHEEGSVMTHARAVRGVAASRGSRIDGGVELRLWLVLCCVARPNGQNE